MGERCSIASCPRWNEPQGGACFLQATGAGSPLAAARCRRSATLNAAARCTLSPCAIAQQCRRAAQIARRRKAAAGHVCGCKGVRCPPATAPQPQHGSARQASAEAKLDRSIHDDGRNLRIFSSLVTAFLASNFSKKALTAQKIACGARRGLRRTGWGRILTPSWSHTPVRFHAPCPPRALA